MSRLLLAELVDTERLALSLAQQRPPDPATALVVFLQGDLGTGKTTLARTLLHALGAAGPIRSPTYTLVEHYPLTEGRAVHVDLYRLRGADELEQLGLRDELQAGVLLLVEWPERAAALLPRPDLQVTLSIAGAGRAAELHAGSAIGGVWLRAAVADFGNQI